MDLVELSRRLENILRIGTIHAVDHAAVKVRVKTGELITQWLPWIEQRAGQTTTWNPPTIGEQAIVFSPSGEPAGGIVLVGIDSTAVQPPSHSPDDHVTRYPDGTLVRYDHAAGIMEALFPDGGEIRYNHPSSHLEAIGVDTVLAEAATSITLDTPLVHITGQCIVEDLLSYQNGLSGLGGTNGSHITGNIRHENGSHEQVNVDQTGSGGQITSNGKRLDTHVHPDLTSGGMTGSPA